MDENTDLDDPQWPPGVSVLRVQAGVLSAGHRVRPQVL